MFGGFKSRRGRGIAAVLLLSMLSASCMTWTAGSSARSALNAPEPPGRCRVTLVSGERLILYAPRVVGDTIVGALGQSRTAAERRVPLTEVRQFEVQKASAAWTAGGILLFGAAIGLFALAIAVANLSGPFENCCS